MTAWLPYHPTIIRYYRGKITPHFVLVEVLLPISLFIGSTFDARIFFFDLLSLIVFQRNYEIFYALNDKRDEFSGLPFRAGRRSVSYLLDYRFANFAFVSLLVALTAASFSIFSALTLVSVFSLFLVHNVISWPASLITFLLLSVQKLLYFYSLGHNFEPIFFIVILPFILPKIADYCLKKAKNDGRTIKIAVELFSLFIGLYLSISRAAVLGIYVLPILVTVTLLLKDISVKIRSTNYEH